MSPNNPKKKMKTDSGSTAIVTVSDGNEEQNGEDVPQSSSMNSSSEYGDANRGKRKLVKSTAIDEKLPIFNPISTRLLDLNDDCLLHIFKYVSILDLCNITQTCSRLNELGNQFFKLKHKICNFRSLSLSDTAEARRVFETFGWLIIELKIHFFSNNDLRANDGEAKTKPKIDEKNALKTAR